MAPEIQFPGQGETIELQQQVARLQALLEASRQVHSTIHEEEVMEQVLRIVVRELEMDGAAFPGTGQVFGDVPTEGEPAERLPRYSLESRDGERMTELVVAAPGGRELTIYEADFVEGLALQAAVALENARNHQRNLEYARVQQDLDAARQIQRSLLPQTLPSIPGYALGFRSDACYEVGGDSLDIVVQPDGSLLLVVADVAGKGLASAIMTTGFRAEFRGMAAAGLALDELAARINQQHWAEGEEARRRYVTAIFVRLHPGSGSLEVVNAGHNPGFLLAPEGAVHTFEAAGPPLGMLPGMEYAIERGTLTPGARLLLYTDGLTEVFRGDEEFGPERLLDAFSVSQPQKADDILDALWTAIQGFADGASQGDDMTALVLCRATGATEMPV